ncbi:MAG: hypothetical protein ACPG5P_08075, partial [Saprospiraceae bacterium]
MGKDEKEKDWQLTSNAAYEYKQIDFTFLSPYRSSEFSRDWNADNSIQANEHLGSLGFQIKNVKLGNLSYDFVSFIRDDIYKGFQQNWKSLINKNGFTFSFNGSFLQTDSQVEKTKFFRPKLNISKQFEKAKGIKIGIFGSEEKNSRFDNLSDTLKNNSIYFDVAGAFFEINKAKKAKFAANYKRNWIYKPVDNSFENAIVADEINVNGNWIPSKISRLNWNMNYRNSRVLNEELTQEENQETYLGRIEHNLNLWKGALRSNTQYEIGSGQEPELEFVYQEVNDGEGVYTWIDRNQDSIQQVDEFEVAVFQDQAQYIRIATFTDRYIRSNLVQFSNSFSLKPKAIWFKEKKGIKNTLSKFSLQNNIKINRKVRQ